MTAKKNATPSTPQDWRVLLAAFGLCLTLYIVSPVLAPFLTALLFAYLFEPMIDKLQMLGMSRVPTILFVLLLFVLTVVVSVLVLIPLLEQQFVLFMQSIPGMVEWFLQKVVPWLQHSLGLDVTQLDPDKLKQTVLEHWQQASAIAKNVFSVVTQSGMKIFYWIAHLVLIPVLMFYLLRDWHGMLNAGRKLLPKRYAPTVLRLFKECDDVLGAFIRGQLLVMLVLAIVYAVGLSIIGLKMGILIGFVSGLLSIIPYLGFAAGLVVSVLVALVQYADLFHVLMVVTVFGIGHVLEGMVLAPMLVGDRIGLHPVMVIFAILTGGELFGFVGALLALPTAAVMMVVLRHAYERYQQSDWYNGGTI